MLKITFVSHGRDMADPTAAAAMPVFEDAPLPQALASAIERATNGRFGGAPGASAVFLAPAWLDVGALVLIGAGPRAKLDDAGFERIGGEALTLASTHGLKGLILRLPEIAPQAAAHAALGARLSAYRFHRHKTKPKASDTVSVATLEVEVDDPDACRDAFAPLDGLADGVFLARDLVSEPANILHPEAYAVRMKALDIPGLEIEIIDEAGLEALGAGSLLSVGLASPYQTCMAVLRWRGAADPEAPPIAFVGKGVTFDTGGISIKPAAGLEEMKADMGGSAAIAGALLALAARKARINAVGVLCIVENAIGGGALRPGDIVTAMSGRTIEVINTDAEGRLALADGLTYCRDRFKPRVMVDVATLTGAVMVALGLDYGGLYSEDGALAEALIAAGQAEGELLWRLPMPESYDRHIESLAADVKNVAVGIGRSGGASIAARFLKPFAGDTPWAHLDISGPAWPTTSAAPTIPAGATGYGVRLLHRFASSFEDTAP